MTQKLSRQKSITTLLCHVAYRITAFFLLLELELFNFQEFFKAYILTYSCPFNKRGHGINVDSEQILQKQ